MSVAELRGYIAQAGMSSADCIEMPDLRARVCEAAARIQRRAGAGPAGAARMGDEEIDAMSVKELRGYIAQAGMSSADCIEKADLRARAREAAAYT